MSTGTTRNSTPHMFKENKKIHLKCKFWLQCTRNTGHEMRWRYGRWWYVTARNSTWQREAAYCKQEISQPDLTLGSWLSRCEEEIARWSGVSENGEIAEDNTNTRSSKSPKWSSRNIEVGGEKTQKRGRRINRIWLLTGWMSQDDAWGFSLNNLPSWK